MSFETTLKQDCWYKETCPVLSEDYDCRKTCHRFIEMANLIGTCGMENVNPYLKNLQASPENEIVFERLYEIKESIDNFINDGKNLCIYSFQPLVGKTTWSLKLMYRFFDKIWSGNGFRTRGYFIHVPQFLMNIKKFDYLKSDEFKNIDKILTTADIVIWDDIILQTDKKDQDWLYSYISNRILNSKSNIFNGRIIKEPEKFIGVRINEYLSTAETLIIK